MKKFLTWIFSVAIMVVLAAVPAYADGGVARKLVANSKTHKTTATTKARISPKKTRIEKGVNAFQARSRKMATKGLNEAKPTASKVKTNAPRKVKANAADNYPTIYGTVSYSDSWNGLDEGAYGLYQLPTSPGGSFDLIFGFGVDANYGGAAKDGVYYVNYYFNFWGYFEIFEVYGFDLETGEEVYYASPDDGYEFMCPGGMALDPTTNQIYGITYNLDPDYEDLAMLDYSTNPPTKTVIAEQLDDYYVAFGIDGTGQFYGIKVDSDGEGILCKLDRTTGASTEVGATGEYPYYLTGACIDARSNRMFWALCTEDDLGYLTEVDLTTGEASLVCMFDGNDEVGGLFVPAPDAADGAPDACTDVEANFTDDALTGTISFTAPATLFNGDALTGQVTVYLTINGEEQTPVTVAAGAQGSFNVTLDEAGLYTFVVYASNDEGAGPKTTLKNIWVGADTPEATKATAKYANGNMEITWLPVDAGINGGYIDTDAITYTVKDDKGNILAEGLTVTTYTYALAAPEEITAYTYNVYVVYGDLVSAPARTNTVVLGSVIPPYAPDFIEDGLSGWTVIDGNDDGRIWTVQEDGSVRMSYNYTEDMDDWLITPPVKLEKGLVYIVAVEAASASASYPEAFEVMWGTDNTAEAMTNTLIGETTVASSDYEQFSATLVPAEDGIYYIGFHGISEADQYYLYLNQIQIGAGISPIAPGMATNLTATTSQSAGNWSATVSFNAPAKTVNDQTLSSLTKVELYRGETLINTFNAPDPGAALSFTDTTPEEGLNTYKVVGYNEEGAGLEVSTDVFVGFYFPEAPEVVNIVATDVPGQVLVTWTAVTQDTNGTPLTPSDVTYTVCTYDNGWVPMASDLTGLEYTFQAVTGDDQDFVQVAVFAETDYGMGTGGVSEMIPVGTPYNGIDETFADGKLTYIWGYSQIGSADLTIADDQTYSDVESVTGDGGYLVIRADYLDEGANFFSGLVSLEGIVNPCLSFYTYNVNNGTDADINEVVVSVRETGNSEWTTVMAPATVDDLCGGEANTWGKVTVDLGAYANKTIQFQITAVVKGYTVIAFDDIKTDSLLDYDLAAASIYAPSKVMPGDNYDIDVTVSNEGVNAASGYSVELYANESLLDTKTGNTIEGGKRTVITFELTMPALATEPISYYAKVVYSQDENMDNNQTGSLTVTPVVSNLPAPTALAANTDDNGVQLTWTAPDLTAGVPVPVTDDFEDADGVTAEYGDWKFYDGDQSPVGGFRDMEIPGITAGSTTGSFWVWDNEVIEGNQTFDAHSGVHYLFALFRYDDGTTDDWAISPKLFGGAQEISFYARSYSSGYPEKIAVYYSTGSQDVADFIMVEGSQVNAVPGEWTQYTCELPAGAQYFAIRSFATGSFMLMVDDVTYTPADSKADLELAGYNVYRNGEKINTALVTTPSYTDAPEVNGQYTYVVTAVYTEAGESKGSNAVTVEFNSAGIDSVAGVPAITVENGAIVVANAEGQHVAVANAAGAVIFSGLGENRTVINVESGIYVVKVANKTAKVLVK